MRDKIEFLRADLMRVACKNNKGLPLMKRVKLSWKIMWGTF